MSEFTGLKALVTGAAPGRWTTDDLRPCTDTALDAFGPGHRLTEAERTALFESTATRVYAL
ncbi:hypothetical protein ACFQ3Z_39545 [Streptomyces nogalater]